MSKQKNRLVCIGTIHTSRFFYAKYRRISPSSFFS